MSDASNVSKNEVPSGDSCDFVQAPLSEFDKSSNEDSKTEAEIYKCKYQREKLEREAIERDMSEMESFYENKSFEDESRIAELERLLFESQSMHHSDIDSANYSISMIRGMFLEQEQNFQMFRNQAKRREQKLKDLLKNANKKNECVQLPKVNSKQEKSGKSPEHSENLYNEKYSESEEPLSDIGSENAIYDDTVPGEPFGLFGSYHQQQQSMNIMHWQLKSIHLKKYQGRNRSMRENGPENSSIGSEGSNGCYDDQVGVETIIPVNVYHDEELSPLSTCAFAYDNDPETLRLAASSNWYNE